MECPLCENSADFLSEYMLTQHVVGTFHARGVGGRHFVSIGSTGYCWCGYVFDCIGELNSHFSNHGGLVAHLLKLSLFGNHYSESHHE